MQPNRDFLNWLTWYRKNVNPTIEEDTARQAYDAYYTCNCESCEQRKRMGVPPLNLGRADCMAPERDLEQIVAAQ